MKYSSMQEAHQRFRAAMHGTGEWLKSAEILQIANATAEPEMAIGKRHAQEILWALVAGLHVERNGSPFKGAAYRLTDAGKRSARAIVKEEDPSVTERRKKAVVEVLEARKNCPRWQKAQAKAAKPKRGPGRPRKAQKQVCVPECENPTDTVSKIFGKLSRSASVSAMRT